MKNIITRKIVACMLILLLSISGVFAAVPSDVKGQSYESAVAVLMEKGIITGDTDGSFNPDSQLNRAQACIIIVKSMNPASAEVVGTATQPASKSDFSDMNGYGWAEGYISYAVRHGVTKGYPDGTFKPGNPVTVNELVAMTLRAAGNTDESIGGTWPSNYVTKATELNIYKGLPEALPEKATKWMAAQIDYNALALIEKANPQVNTKGASLESVAGVPLATGMDFADSRFNSTMTEFNGITIDDNVKIYTFGLQKDYKSTMSLSNSAADYLSDTVYKYKNVEVPAFYRLENDKIVAMILPKDAGFTGQAYVVINGTFTAANGKGESVSGLETLAATREIKWLGEKGLTGVPSNIGNDSYMNGSIYELKLYNGEIRNIAKSTDSHIGKIFDEVTGNGFTPIESYKDHVLKFNSGNLIEIKSNATVYVIDAGDPSEYRPGKDSDIRSGNQIRVYDISDDKETSGDIVIIQKN